MDSWSAGLRIKIGRSKIIRVFDLMTTSTPFDLQGWPSETVGSGAEEIKAVQNSSKPRGRVRGR